MRAITGTLLSTDVLRALSGDAVAAAALQRVVERALAAIGPATSSRAMFDVLTRPLASNLGIPVAPIAGMDDSVAAMLSPDALVITTAWNADLRRAREHSRALMTGARWWIGLNGRTLRLVDAAAAYSRRAADVDLGQLTEDLAAATALHAVLHRCDGSLDALRDVVTRSDAHRVAVSRTLERGVEEALVALVGGLSRGQRRSASLDEPMRDSLTVIYRVLFLLFAEARGLVPHWHPTYRKSYTIESLRGLVERHRSPAGLWEAIQAISRLAHRGCRAGSLRLTPFNGRLFAPSSAPLADTLRVRDDVARDALIALTTRRAADRRERIAYADLGVEQLGAVYERVLDLAPAMQGGKITLVRSGARKATGTFYTPRQMTEFLVRRTLAPLVHARSPEQVLNVRVLDPAMGSGAFLVAACRYLADAYERALLRESALVASDISSADRAAFRRIVAQRCLYGVDRNPMAVQVARLSLWLCTLAADKPLTFLDHHLRSGNSLAGASLADVGRQPPGRGGRPSIQALPLFDEDHLRPPLQRTVRQRCELAELADDSAAVVRRKERIEEMLESKDAPLGRMRAIADAWCAGWFAAERIPAPLWSALRDALAGRPSSLPAHIEGHWTSRLTDATASQRFFHWELEFPEVFVDETGAERPDGGFDALIGNPPWDMLRGEAAGRVAEFARHSGCYRAQGDGHANLYQLFAERMFRLTRPGGRFGWLMPSGLLADHGSATLRRLLLEQSQIDAVLSFDNREAIFPIHRSMKFALLTGTRGGRSHELPARFALTSPAVLDDVPDVGEPRDAVHIPMTLIRQFSGDGLAVPELATPRDRAIVAAIFDAVPLLASDEGWGVRFGRELNATDDKPLFGRTGLPVLEGKHIEPFTVHADEAAAFIEDARAHRALGSRPYACARLGYREVASATNRLTLIAAVLPPMVVTTHTVFCLKTRVPHAVQWFLCGVLNSYVANYVVRLRGGTHVPAAVIHRLPVPVLPFGDERFREVARLAERLTRPGEPPSTEVELQVRVAELYPLTPEDLDHVISTFPLVDADARSAVARAFRARFNAI